MARIVPQTVDGTRTADTLADAMRALVVSNMYPSAEAPARGSFVRDQVEALRRIADVELELFTFSSGSNPAAYARAAAQLRRRFTGRRFDVVHAHFGLTAWPALAAPARARVVTLHGTDLSHPRSRPITLAALRAYDLVAAVSEPLARTLPAWASRAEVAVLPCGVDTRRFVPIERASARGELGLPADRPLLLFPSDPARPEKRYDLARALAGDLELLVLRDVEPERVPLWVNAVNAVVIPSDREGFGLAALEALACDVPVLSTPVGIAPDVLSGLPGAYCGPFELAAWQAALAPHLSSPDPRIAGRSRAELFSADRMANRVVAAWQALM
jgi:teichuronic acid biosynthesis glycosyltransferase TuaC